MSNMISPQEIAIFQHLFAAEGIVKLAGTVKVSHTGRAPRWDQFYQLYITNCVQQGILPTVDVPQLASAAVRILPESSAVGQWDPVFPTVETISDLIAQGMKHYRIEMGPNGESIRCGGVDIQYDVLESQLKEYAREYEEDSKVPGQKENGRKVFTCARISDALKVFVNNRDITAREILRKNIYYKEEHGVNCTAFHLLKRVMELFQVREDHDLSTVMMMQWMWQTKRYAMGMEVLEPMMVNFMGSAQGTMKTSFIEALTTPFKQYRVPSAKLAQVMDEREYTLWAKKYVVIFDELQKGRMSKGEMGSLITAMKSLLTAKSVGGRVMKTTHHIEMQRIFSPISSSNASIVHVIRDKTGMRRFYEMNVMTQTRAHPELITIVNALIDISGEYASMVWGSINEHLPHGYMELDGWKDKLLAVQDTYQVIDSLDLWLSSGDLKDVPVVRTSMEESAIISHINGLDTVKNKKGIKALNDSISPMSWQLDYELAKEAVDWVDDAMGKNAAQYVGGREHLVQHLESLGHVIAHNGIDTYVLCKGSNPAASIPGGI